MAPEVIELNRQKEGTYRIVWFCVLIVALLLGLYSIGFIAGTSFVVEGQRYFCLFDDAMISMRYADNWANGNGLVWNPGQRVEGYTTFLWTLIMGLCHLPNLTPSHTCLLVQILGIVALWLCLAATAVLARSSGLDSVSACIAVVLTGTYYNLIFFSLFGMETGLLTAMMTFAFADTISCVRKRQANIRASLWLAPILLMRPDMLPVILACTVSVIFFAYKGRKSAIAGLILAACIVSAHLIWRRSFYGQWLPNTYYLKMTGWPLTERFGPGLRQSAWSIVTLALPVSLAFVALIRYNYYRILLFGSFLFGLAYQTYVGGDAWPLSRFIIPYTPGLFILAGEGIARLSELITKKTYGWLSLTSAAVLSFLCILNFNLIHWDHFLLLTRPQTTCENWMNVKYVHAVKRCADDDVTVAVTWAGVFPYFSGFRCIDLMGKCDPYIARLAADPEAKRAGHNKHDIRYSLNTYHPDIVLHVLRGGLDQQLGQTYTPVVVEVGSYQMVLAVYNKSSKVRIDRKISWFRHRDYLWMIARENELFQAYSH
jgi:hypothetical protein